MGVREGKSNNGRGGGERNRGGGKEDDKGAGRVKRQRRNGREG